MTTAEVAKLLGVAPDRVLGFIHRGWLSSKLVPTNNKHITERHDVSEEALEDFYNRCVKKVGVPTPKYPEGHIYWVEKSNPKVRVNYQRKLDLAEETLEDRLARIEARLDEMYTLLMDFITKPKAA